MSGPWDPTDKVDVEDMLEVLQVENLRREGRNEMRFSCPFPTHDNGDKNASAYMNVESTAWYCHGCKRKGATAVPLVAYMLDISPMKAKRALREAYDPASFKIEDRDIAQELREYVAKQTQAKPSGWLNKEIDEDAIDGFLVDWPAANNAWVDGNGFPPCDYMLGRGFLPGTLDAWEFGYDDRTDRIVFPVRDHLGKLIGFKGRSTDGRDPKYLVVGDSEGKPERYGFPRYYTGLVVFGLHEALKHLDENKVLIICEGELNAIALWQMGFKNAVALNGSRLTRRQQALVRSHAEEVIMFFDFDKAGQEGMWGHEDEKGFWHLGAIDLLARDCGVRLVGSHDEDAAAMMQAGRQEDVEALVYGANSYIAAVLDRLR